MKRCEHCGHINSDIFKVCETCGRGLPKAPNLTESEYQQALKQAEQNKNNHYNEADSKFEPGEMQELIRSVNTIKKCCIFFVAFTIISIIAGLLLMLSWQP